jgi:hypothetical protein
MRKRKVPELERRKATPDERQAWRMRQAPWLQHALNNTLIVGAGSFSGLLLAAAAATALAPEALAQTPIKFSDGGLETIFWFAVTALGTTLLGVLTWILKAWVDHTNAKIEAQDVAVATLRAEVSYLRGKLED